MKDSFPGFVDGGMFWRKVGCLRFIPNVFSKSIRSLVFIVNNAGIIIRGSALNIQDSVLKRSCFDLNVLMKEHEALMDINVKGTFNLSKVEFHRIWISLIRSQLCNRLLKAAGSSSVILMGSIAGGETATSAGW